jgi:hypothetical protein
MRATAAAPKIEMLNEEDYPEELAEFLAYVRELDAEGGPHWARVDRGGELERYLSILGALGKPSGQLRRRGRPRRDPPAGPRKVGRSKSSGMRKD